MSCSKWCPARSAFQLRQTDITPEGATALSPKPRPDETLIKALVRADRWRRRVESGQAKSITDLAAQEGVTDAYVCRLPPLTCLAPGVVEARCCPSVG
jgi:site-specific DNA recombinase